jgi:SAM-dependent methyltransferase
MKDKYKKFWIKDNLKSITTFHSLTQGEWDIKDYFRKLRARLECQTILDFGCGYGRMFPCFSDCPTVYFGVDLNPIAVNKARQNFPKYKNRFCEVDINSHYAYADMILAFTVFLHLDDDTLKLILTRLHESCKKYLVIVETLGREWRPEMLASYDLPLYNRDLDEYVEMLAEVGFELAEKDSKPIPHYENNMSFKDRNCNTNILIFRRV